MHPAQPASQVQTAPARPSQPLAPAHGHAPHQPPPIGQPAVGHPAMGQPGYSAHPVPPPHGASARKSKTGLYIGLGVGALAVAGGIIAVVLLTGKDKASGGEASREGVVRKTFAALARGDADALMKLSGAETRDKLFKCKGEEKLKPDRDLLRAPYKKAADATKGVKLEVIEIGTDDDPDVMEKGKTFGDDELECTALVKSIEHRFDVRFKATQPERKEVEQELRVSVVSIDGGWYLSEVPEIKLAGSCDTAVAHAVDKAQEQMLRQNGKADGEATIKAALADIRTIGIKHCKDDSWDDSVLECLGETTDAKSMDVCMKQLSTTQREKFETEAAAAFTKHQPKVEPPPPPPPDTSGTVALGPNCQEYKRTIETIQCAEISEESRKALLDSFDEVIKLAAGSTGDPEQGCQVAVSTLKQMCNQ